MWDRFYANRTKYFVENTPKNTEFYNQNSFDFIEETIELAWERPELRNRLLWLCEKKLKESVNDMTKHTGFDVV